LHAGGGLIMATTWDPAQIHGALTLSAGNLQSTSGDASDDYTQVTTTSAAWTTQKVYMEMTGYISAGVGSYYNSTNSRVGLLDGGGLAGFTHSLVWFQDGRIWFNNSATGMPTGASFGVAAATLTVGVAIDRTNMRAWARPHGANWNGTAGADPAANVGGINISAFVGAVTLYMDLQGAANQHCQLNAGATAFLDGPPAGFNGPDYLAAGAALAQSLVSVVSH
jgi:hypothetical protein